MKKNHEIFALYLFVLSIVLSSCAQMIPLSGGEKDVEPPKLIFVNPAHLSTSFTGKELQLQFDEFIQLRDVQQQLLITPALNQAPELSVQGKILKVHFKEPLQQNTTYSVNFGNCVSDVHESNIASGLNIVFSTGNYLDSLSLSGTVSDAFTGKKNSGTAVFMYLNGEDSCIYKSNPNYLAKTDAFGNYRIDHIQQGKYRVFALDDKNKNLRADADESAAALNTHSGILELDSDARSDFRISTPLPKKLFAKRIYHTQYGKCSVVFNRPAKAAQISFLRDSEKNSTAYFSRKSDTLYLFYGKSSGDSIFLLVKESGLEDLTLTIACQDKEKMERDIKAGKLHPQISSLINLEEGKFNGIRFNWPIKSIQEEKIKIIQDKNEYRIGKPISRDKFECQFENVYERTGTSTLLLLPGAITTEDGYSNDTLKYIFSIKTAEEIGSFQLNLVLPDSNNYLLELLNERGYPLETRTIEISGRQSLKHTIRFNRLLPANYSLRLICDQNADGIWNAGDLIERSAAESVFYFTKPIKILSDWEISDEWRVINTK